MSGRTDIYIVGQNIGKAEIHAMQRSKGVGARIVRVAHGIYFALRSRESDPKPEQDAEVNSLFALYGLRIAHHLLPDAGLTYATAYYRAPIDGRIFVGGAYFYRKKIAQEYGDFGIIQSSIVDNRDKESVREVLSNHDFFTVSPVTDPVGTFHIPVQTKEMILLTQYESVKLNQDKLLKKADINRLTDELVLQYGGEVPLLSRLQQLAIKAGKTSEYERLLKTILSTKS